ncbi:vacuolar sorting protein [Niveomyces insectorum RCEF 264]|uniref:Vacuolar sorting protein n=1 Tax=Niveomyces insectorum RCEF 264 TaxID=1081102 RepID=A0A167YXA9_9HYPO|nr:vacuolar sorting protein [Niveomyces insectorum RCEF 264]
MASDIGASLVSYLQLFDARCTQLILDAGARRSAGLKNITSKHLVLASQALAFIATLISHVREFVRRYAGSGAATSSVVEFDTVKRRYQEHQNSINDKLVEIMSRLAASHVKAMKHIDWDDGQKHVHPYMATLAKDATSLHRILTKTLTLPKGTVRMLMTPVFVSYKVQFGEAFQEVDPKTESGRDSMLHDVEHFESKLGKMVGFGDTGEYLTKIIKSKQASTASAAPAAAEPEKKDTEKTAKEETEAQHVEDV